MSNWVRGKELAAAFAQAAELRKANEEVFREAVARQVCAGLSDYQVARRLLSTAAKVAAVRETLGLPANPRGGAT
jgi:hypothetical protein